MHDLDDQTRKTILGEVLMDELKVIREYLELIVPLVQKIPSMEQDIGELKADMQVMQLLYREHEQWIKNHEIHHTHFETAH